MCRNGQVAVLYERAVSMKSTAVPFAGWSDLIVRVPPRCPAPDWRTATSTYRRAATPWGRCPRDRIGGPVRQRIDATSVQPNWLLTQTPRRSTATAAGPLPTGITPLTAFVSGSIRETVPSSEFATHAPPTPKAIPVGPFPTWI